MGFLLLKLPACWNYFGGFQLLLFPKAATRNSGSTCFPGQFPLQQVRQQPASLWVTRSAIGAGSRDLRNTALPLALMKTPVSSICLALSQALQEFTARMRQALSSSALGDRRH